MSAQFRGKRLFGGRLFVGRLFGPPVDQGVVVAAGGVRLPLPRQARKRRRDRDDDVLLFLLR